MKSGLLKPAEVLSIVLRACRVMGFSRDTFYRSKTAVEEGGIEVLIGHKTDVGLTLRPER